VHIVRVICLEGTVVIYFKKVAHYEFTAYTIPSNDGSIGLRSTRYTKS
jgi:hypothetical protein